MFEIQKKTSLLNKHLEIIKNGQINKTSSRFHWKAEANVWDGVICFALLFL